MFSNKIRETKTTLSMDMVTKNEHLLNSFITHEAELLHDFYSFWLDAPISKFILRIEDLVVDPEDTLSDLFRFLFDRENLKGS